MSAAPLTVIVAPGSIPTDPLKRRHRPPVRSDYHLYRPCLRNDFGFRCVYCQSHEAEVGPGLPYGGFDVEHHKPKQKFRALTSRYDNLLWACRTCNGAKRDTWPSPKEEAQGYRFVDPSRERLSDHIELRGTQLIALTRPGEFTIDELELNLGVHVQRRARRLRLTKLVAWLEAVIERPGRPVPASARDYLKEARNSLGLLPPWDAPNSCLCS